MQSDRSGENQDWYYPGSRQKQEAVLFLCSHADDRGVGHFAALVGKRGEALLTKSKKRKEGTVK